MALTAAFDEELAGKTSAFKKHADAQNKELAEQKTARGHSLSPPHPGQSPKYSACLQEMRNKKSCIRRRPCAHQMNQLAQQLPVVNNGIGHTQKG